MKNQPIVLYDLEGVYDSVGQCDCAETDCACSLPVEKHNFINLKLDQRDVVKIPSNARKIPLDSDFSIWYGEGFRPAVMNQFAADIAFLFKNPKTLGEIAQNLPEIDPDVLQKTVEDFIKCGLFLREDSVDQIDHNPQLLSAWVHITDRCNLRCQYCYLPHMLEDMSWDTGLKVIDAIFNAAEKQGSHKVKIKYAGGEPLLRSDFLFKLHAYAASRAESKKIEFDAVILSNGTLLDGNIIQLIKSYSLKLMISLDGMREWHDTHRPYAGGKGSFDSVKKSILLCLSNQLKPDISITVSSRNSQNLAEVVEWVLDNDLPFSLNFYRENDLSKQKEELRIEEKSIIQDMLAAYKVIERKLPKRSLLSSLLDRSNLSFSHSRTCGVGQNYLVFDQHGGVSKCQMAMKHLISKVDSPNLLNVIREDTTGIQNMPVAEKQGCSTCEWQTWCAGGCPLATYRATGRYDLKSPNCNIYKSLFPEALRLEGLRLLKYGNVLQ